MDVNFDELVQDSEKLLMDVQGYTDIPYIARSLDQLRTFGDKLHLSRGPRSDIKAARLLGNKISYELPEQLSTKLEAMGSSGPMESMIPSSKLDIQSFLKTERENALLNVIAMSQRSLFEDIESRTSRTVRSWWNQEASAILSTLAGSSNLLDTDLLNYTSTTESMIEDDLRSTKLSMHDQTHSTENRTREELCYARQIERFLCNQLQSRCSTDLINSPVTTDLLVYLSDQNSNSMEPELAMSSVSRATPTQSHSELLEIWRLFARFAQVLPSPSPSRSSMASKIESRASNVLQNDLVLSALSHLEAEFVSYLHIKVANHPRLARLGGRPGTRTLVKAYLNIHLPNAKSGEEKNSILDRSAGDSLMMFDDSGIEYEDGFVDSKPVWPMIYYCLRAGDSEAAIEVANCASGNLENVASILQEYVHSGRTLSPPTLTKLRQMAIQVDKLSRDPFKRLVISILGLSGMKDSHSEVVQSIDDFLWVKLSQVAAAAASNSLTTSNSVAEPVRLSQLQLLLHDTYGEVHFDAWSQPWVYFKLLCLTQQFEAAIAFLSRFETLRTHAVHIALALHKRGVLLLSDTIQLPLISRNETDPLGLRRLNLARLVMLYTRKFERTYPMEALMYFYFLSNVKSTMRSQTDSDDSRDASSRVGDNLFVTCLTELLFGTREFELLLGSFSESGIRKPGALDRYCLDPEERQELVSSIARAFENRGQLFDSIHLFQLAAEFCPNKGQPYYRKALSLLNHLLAGLVSIDPTPAVVGGGVGPTTRPFGQPDRGYVILTATKFATRLHHLDLGQHQLEDTSFSMDDEFPSCSDGGLKTLHYLLDLATFFDLIQAQQWQAAIDHMDQLGIFPTNPQFSEVESKVLFFTQLPDFVRQPIPTALLAMMQAFVQLAKQPEIRSLDLQLDNRSKWAKSILQNRAKSLVSYVGRIPYKSSGDVYARITQMNMEIM